MAYGDFGDDFGEQNNPGTAAAFGGDTSGGFGGEGFDADRGPSIGSQKGDQTIKGGSGDTTLKGDAGTDLLNIFGSKVGHPTALDPERSRMSWADRVASNKRGLPTNAWAGIQQAHVGSGKPDTDIVEDFKSIPSKFAESIIGKQPGWNVPVAKQGSLITDFNPNFRSMMSKGSKEFVDKHRTETTFDKTMRGASHAVNIGGAIMGTILTGGLAAPAMAKTLGSAAWTESKYADVMAAKGVGKSTRNFEVGNMSYGTPEVYGTPREYSPPPSFGGASEDKRRIVKTSKTGTFPRVNEVQLAVASPPTRTGPTRAQMRGGGRQGRTGRGWV